MNIKVFIQQFIENYLKFREANLDGKDTVRTNSNINNIKASLERALTKVLDPDSIALFSIPTLGLNQDAFYNLMNEFSPVYLSQVWANYQVNKSEFLSTYAAVIKSEISSLQIYGAVALNCRNSQDPLAIEYANQVMRDLQGWSNALLGASFVYFRLYSTTILDGINRILENEEAQEFMLKEKIQIDINEPVVDILPKLEILEKKVLALKEAGLVDDPIKFSLRDEIESFFSAQQSTKEESAQSAEA